MCLISDDDVGGCVHTSSVDGCVAVSAVKVECESCLKGVLFRFVEHLFEDDPLACIRASMAPSNVVFFVRC